MTCRVWMVSRLRISGDDIESRRSKLTMYNTPRTFGTTLDGDD